MAQRAVLDVNPVAEVGIRALEIDARAIVARAAAGETITITDRGRPVARMTALPSSRLQAVIESGHARPPRRPLPQLPPAARPAIAEALAELRGAERY